MSSSKPDVQHKITQEYQYNNNYWINTENKRRKVTAQVQLKYQKTNYNITERLFDIESFSRGDAGYHIHGFCHSKKKRITLCSLGFIDPVDTETGESISDIKIYLEDKYSASSHHKQDLLFDKYGWAIYSLIYLSATSGRTEENERNIIKNFIKSIDGFDNLSDAWISSTILKLYRPGKLEIRRWIKKAFEDGENVQLIHPEIEKLAALPTNGNLEFKSFVKYLSNLTTNSRAATLRKTVSKSPEADIDRALAGLIELINVDEEKARFDQLSNEPCKPEALRILKSQPPIWYDHSKGHTFLGYTYADYARTLIRIGKPLDGNQQVICDYFASLAIIDGTISAGTIAEMANIKGLIAENRGEPKRAIAFLKLAILANPKLAVNRRLAELETEIEPALTPIIATKSDA